LTNSFSIAAVYLWSSVTHVRELTQYKDAVHAPKITKSQQVAAHPIPQGNMPIAAPKTAAQANIVTVIRMPAQAKINAVGANKIAATEKATL
jgi:hypothetical protein